MHFGFRIYNELFAILAKQRKMFPKHHLPNTATRVQREAEEARRAGLNEKEAERLTAALEKDGTITQVSFHLVISGTLEHNDFLWKWC